MKFTGRSVAIGAVALVLAAGGVAGANALEGGVTSETPVEKVEPTMTPTPEATPAAGDLAVQIPAEPVPAPVAPAPAAEPAPVDVIESAPADAAPVAGNPDGWTPPPVPANVVEEPTVAPPTPIPRDPALDAPTS